MYLVHLNRIPLNILLFIVQIVYFKASTPSHLVYVIFHFSLGFEKLGDQGAEFLALALKENNALEELRYKHYLTQ